MSEIQVFSYGEGWQIRTAVIYGKMWFMAVDVCKLLGITNTTDAIKSLDSRDKASLRIGLRGSPPNFVNESGLNALILASRKPEAQQFRRWVTSEVLPSIRKTGSYSVQPQLPADPFETMIQAVKEMRSAVDSVSERLDRLENASKPKPIGLPEGNKKLRELFMQKVRQIVARSGFYAGTVLNIIYDTMIAESGIDFRAEAKRRGVKTIDIIEQRNMLARAVELAEWNRAAG